MRADSTRNRPHASQCPHLRLCSGGPRGREPDLPQPDRLGAGHRRSNFDNRPAHHAVDGRDTTALRLPAACPADPSRSVFPRLAFLADKRRPRTRASDGSPSLSRTAGSTPKPKRLSQATSERSARPSPSPRSPMSVQVAATRRPLAKTFASALCSTAWSSALFLPDQKLWMERRLTTLPASSTSSSG